MSNIKNEAFGYDPSDITTFMGLPEGDLSSLDGVSVAIVGAPIATPYPGFGLFSAAAPNAIRAGVAFDAPFIGHHDFDFGGSLLEDEFGAIVVRLIVTRWIRALCQR